MEPSGRLTPFRSTGTTVPYQVKPPPIGRNRPTTFWRRSSSQPTWKLHRLLSLNGVNADYMLPKSLTFGLDMGDRSSCYCVLDETKRIMLERKVSTTLKALQATFKAMPRSRIALETGTHSPLGQLATERFGP